MTSRVADNDGREKEKLLRTEADERNLYKAYAWSIATLFLSGARTDRTQRSFLNSSSHILLKRISKQIKKINYAVYGWAISSIAGRYQAAES